MWAERDEAGMEEDDSVICGGEDVISGESSSLSEKGKEEEESSSKSSSSSASIDKLLSQLIDLSKKSPMGSQSGSCESLEERGKELSVGGVGALSSMAPWASVRPFELEQFLGCSSAAAAAAGGAEEEDYLEGRSPFMDWLNEDTKEISPSFSISDDCSIGSDLTPEEEAAICALVPKLVKVSMSKPVRGVYLDKRRGLWRANWREGGKVKTKGFRVAQWGESEARRKAVEVRKLMETRGCFLKLKAVAMGDSLGGGRLVSGEDFAAAASDVSSTAGGASKGCSSSSQLGRAL